MDCIMKGQYVLYNFNVTKIKKKNIMKIYYAICRIYRAKSYIIYFYIFGQIIKKKKHEK